MNNKISNPLLKQLISEIANKANQGRITNLNWKSLQESKNILKKEADQKKGEEDDVGALLGGGGGEAAAAPAKDKAAPQADAKGAAPEAPAADAGAEVPNIGGGDVGAEEDPEKAQADAAKKKAELEKAKAEKDQAEEELKKQSYVKLKSSGGLQFMLGKILNHAFRTNTIDALASEMAQKLKITTTNDVAAFEEDMALYRNIPGMADLLSSIKTIATKKPEEPSEEEPTI